MKKVTGKRFCAYIVDYVIVALIASLFARVPILNPNYDRYMEEYNKYIESVKTSLNDSASDEIIDNSYEMTKLGVNITIINLVVGAIYFVGFQYLNKGQTLGKKMLKIRMVDDNNERPKLYQVLIHSIIINSLLTTTISVITLLCLSKATYLNISEVVQIIDMGLLFGSFGCMIVRKDGKGIHNILAHTNVIGE
ncbi:MAG: RDD family protein [Bacilli bacterium]|nr:RDD family protein [Bacilli bacterium]